MGGGLDYQLGIGVQPMVNPDQVQVTLTPRGPWLVSQAKGLFAQLDGSRATMVNESGRDLTAHVRFERR